MLRSLLPAFLVLSAVFCASASGWEKKPIIWVSHRGECWEAPENTAKAFDLARINGSDGCECDAQLSKDGKVMISHDSSTKRMSGQDLRIAEHSAEELRKLNVAGRFREKGGSAQIPYLQEVFPLVGAGRFLSIELKDPDPRLIAAIKELIPSSGLKAEQIEFCSFSRKSCRDVKAALPEHRVMWTKHKKKPLTTDQVLTALREIKADGVNIYWGDPFLTKEAVQTLHDNGYLVLAWTVDKPEIAWRMIDLGVDAITSNCASKLKKQFNGK